MKSYSIFLYVCMCLSIATISKAQENVSKQIIDNGDTLKPGYIVLKDQADTLHGYIIIKTAKLGNIEQVKFLEEGQEKKSKYGNFKSDLRFFGTPDKRYRYVNWTDDSVPTTIFQRRTFFSGWVALIEEGAITISLGFEYSGGGTNTGGAFFTTMTPGFNGIMVTTTTPAGPVGSFDKSKTYYPVYCLKKGNRPLALIQGHHTSQTVKDDVLSYQLNERNKNYFISLIKDDSELLAKWNNKVFYFYNVLKIVQEYNERAKE